MKYNLETRKFEALEQGNSKPAIIGSDKTYSWLEFKNRVEEIIKLLEKKQLAKSQKPILIIGHKQADMITCFYALMSLDISYIPIDSSYPIERINAIIESSESQLIINLSSNNYNQFKHVNQLNLLKNQFIFKQTITPKTKEEKNPINYIIYTSGSTGKPKGVQISKEAIVNFSEWMSKDFNFTSNDVFINTAILSFDLSVFEVITFAKIGGTIVLSSKEKQSKPIEFLELIKKHKGTTIVATPSYILKYSKNEFPEKVTTLKTFLFCGEVLPHQLAKKLIKNYPNTVVYNTYGPTEATVATTIVKITDEIIKKYDPLPVGYPKSDTKILINNDEIIIVGKNVSSGYVKNTSLNKKKFSIIDNERAFKTGDLGYFKDNLLFFKGRNDDLIKMHGYRIELNEISTALMTIKEIKNNAVIALKRNGIAKKIVSFVECEGKINQDAIKEKLAKIIPEYMIPSEFRQIQNIPLNANGKLDKKMLEKLYISRKINLDLNKH